ncbi:hypothetical protein GCM10027048_20310 [Hymenobacter coalescens]
MYKFLFRALQLTCLAMLLLTTAHTVAPAETLAAFQAVPFGADLHAALLLHSLGSTVLTAGVCLPLDHIVEDDCGANPGGTVDLYVMRRRDIQTFPEPAEEGDVVLTQPIVPKAGKGFVKWDHATDTGDVNHKSNGDEGNQSVSVEQNVYIPRGNPNTDKVINSALNGSFVVISRDSLGQLRVLGNQRRGVKFDYDYKSGKKGTDKNGTDFKFSGEGFASVPLYYEAAIPLLGAATT